MDQSPQGCGPSLRSLGHHSWDGARGRLGSVHGGQGRAHLGPQGAPQPRRCEQAPPSRKTSGVGGGARGGGLRLLLLREGDRAF